MACELYFLLLLGNTIYIYVNVEDSDIYRE